jgi:hypothetical protein
MKYALMLALLTTLATACTSTNEGMHGSADMKMDKPMSSGTAMDMEKKKKDDAPMSGGGM